MEKRQILFIVISLAFLLFWDYFYVRKQNVQNKSFNQITSKQNRVEQRENINVTKTVEVPVNSITVKTFDTDLYHIVIAKENGFFKRVDLKKFKKTLNSLQPIDILREGKIDSFDIIEVDGKNHRVIYTNMEFKELPTEIQVNFYGTVEDIEIVKTLTLSKNEYGGNVRYYVRNNNGNRVINLTKVMSLAGTVFDTSVEANPQPAVFYNSSFDMPSERSLKKGYLRENVLFAGYAEKYFAVFLVDDNKNLKVESKLEGDKSEIKIRIMQANLSPNSMIEREIKYYAGPKEEKALKKINDKLVASIDYGWFHFISKPLLLIMNFFNKFTHNYGISIILLTILIKIVFFPLSHKSYKSMKELQKLQPKMEELRKKFANDREALNREMMLLYRRHGVNPVSGCLPILVQIPFFIALYQALMHAIELRHAPFFGWIKDLSNYDPYYITPILMGLTMLIQQILTPSSGDPTQKKMMYILPVVFTFMFLKFPSGLVLYWLVNNVFSILQQVYTLKTQKA
ncbi:MAG: membrane protein insertase YidC [Proteobacteria bacterium]|nr:membrane protein insertase YidC [Pseudomonadota bacterium]